MRAFTYNSLLVENADIELLKSLLAKELGYLPGGDGIDALLRRGQLMDFRGGEAIIEAGCNYFYVEAFFRDVQAVVLFC